MRVHEDNNSATAADRDVLNLVPHDDEIADGGPVINDAARKITQTHTQRVCAVKQITRRRVRGDGCHLLLIPLRLSSFMTNFILLGES